MIYTVIFIIVGIITLLLIINSNDDNNVAGIMFAGMAVAIMISVIFYVWR